MENNIKDLQNGMDFHHFPCMSLKANHVWGIVGIIAYNLMRYTSFCGEREWLLCEDDEKEIGDDSWRSDKSRPLD